jgi:protein-tyrosine-phosphatase
MKKILFVCIENAGRSQMAEGFARIHWGNKVETFSAGSLPAANLNLKAVQVMHEIGYDLSTHHPKSLQEIPDVEYDCVVTMGCGDTCPFVRTKTRIEWNIPDPKNLSLEDVREVRDTIQEKVKELLVFLNT